MFIELVSILRCPRPHEDTWLVATIDDMENRDIVNGVLGCPVCHAEYRVRDRVAYFAEPANGPRDGTVPSPQQAMRLAAALELTEARSVAVLNGDWSAQARLVRALSPAQLLVLNPTSAIDAGDGVSVVVSAVAPLAIGSVDAAAVDAGASRPVVDSLVRALRSPGRMLAPVTVDVPGEIVELARDESVWVGERQATAAPVIPLARRPR